MPNLIYVLEDDADVSRIIERALTEQGMEAVTFRRMADFLREVARRQPDACLLDLSLPDGDGLSLLRGQPALDDVPKVIVTGRDTVPDRIIGLEIGADDYVTKPFEPRELVARLRAVLRRTRKAEAPVASDIAYFAEWTADFAAMTLTHSDGTATDLSAAEASLLAAFVNNPGRVMSRAQIMDATIGRADDPTDRSLDARISRLRRKLGDDPRNPSMIRTVYGAGYLFSLKVTRQP